MLIVYTESGHVQTILYTFQLVVSLYQYMYQFQNCIRNTWVLPVVHMIIWTPTATTITNIVLLFLLKVTKMKLKMIQYQLKTCCMTRWSQSMMKIAAK
jgi:hypothetical protein